MDYMAQQMDQVIEGCIRQQKHICEDCKDINTKNQCPKCSYGEHCRKCHCRHKDNSIDCVEA